MESFLKMPFLDRNAAPSLAIISTADLLYRLKWRLINITFLTIIYKWRVTLILFIMREKAALRARRLLHVVKRCFVFLLCAVLFIALCMVPSKRITESERYAKVYYTPTGEEMKRNFVVVLLFPRELESVIWFW